jgi:hypothetical protein
MTTVFMLAGHSEKRKQAGGVNQVADQNSGESGQKRDFGGSRAGKRKKKRLDELTGIYSQRVVSRPFRVTGCITRPGFPPRVSRLKIPAGDSGPIRKGGLPPGIALRRIFQVFQSSGCPVGRICPSFSDCRRNAAKTADTV